MMDDKKGMNRGMDIQAKMDVLKAIKKLASEAMMEGMDEDEALVAEVDMRTVPVEEAEDMVEDAMGGEMPEMESLDEEDMESLDESDEDEDEDDMMRKALKSKLGL